MKEVQEVIFCKEASRSLKTKDTATLIVKGMHAFMDEWCHDMQSRKNRPENIVVAVDNKVLTPAFMAQHNLTWEAVPCKAGEVRLSVPQLPHGAQPSLPHNPLRVTVLPWYYLLYVCLRPDHKYALHRYPYYAKLAEDKDKTIFRHIDVNPKHMEDTDLGINLIQGSTSLTDETEHTATIIVKGMHNHFSD